MRKQLKRIKKNLINVPGWVTSKKIVVIESDDWGSVSMPSLEAYNRLLAAGVPVDKSSFTQFDSLESEEDLNELFNVLTKYRDFKGNHPCITACAVVANPDFDKIAKLLKAKVIFDGRNLYDVDKMEAKGFYYESIGRRKTAV